MMTESPSGPLFSDLWIDRFVAGRELVVDRCARKVLGLADAIERVSTATALDPGRRWIVGIAGYPASGKTTYARRMAAEINRGAAPGVAAAVPLDGFHWPRRTLVGRGQEREKGQPHTYDVEAFGRMLKRFKETRTALAFPDYVRRLHDVVPESIHVPAEARLLIVDGVYVGHCDGGWRAATDAVDLLFFLCADARLCVARSIRRNREVGRGDDAILAKIENDLHLMRITRQIAPRADGLLRQLDEVD